MPLWGAGIKTRLFSWKRVGTEAYPYDVTRGERGPGWWRERLRCFGFLIFVFRVCFGFRYSCFVLARFVGCLGLAGRWLRSGPDRQTHEMILVTPSLSTSPATRRPPDCGLARDCSRCFRGRTDPLCPAKSLLDSKDDLSCRRSLDFGIPGGYPFVVY